MIVLHRPNGYEVVVNADLIETVEIPEGSSESLVTLTTGNLLVVRERPDDVRAAVVAFRRTIGLP